MQPYEEIIWLSYEKADLRTEERNRAVRMGEAAEASLNLEPDAWKYKDGSGYSVTEGMEYELFTEKFENLYNHIRETEEQSRKALEAAIFLKDFSVQTSDEVWKAGLFLEPHKSLRREETESLTAHWEYLGGIGLLAVLFCVLARVTFRKRSRKRG